MSDMDLAERVAQSIQTYSQFSIFDDVNIAVENRAVHLTGRVTMPVKKDDISKRVGKIDGQFVANVAMDAVDRSMVEAIGKIGAAMQVATIAEKVETAEVLEVLKRIGVDYIQGFHLAEPCAIEEVFGCGD
jgi:predicted signal transduction protein with EAL and GGDEF domain